MCGPGTLLGVGGFVIGLRFIEIRFSVFFCSSVYFVFGLVVGGVGAFSWGGLFLLKSNFFLGLPASGYFYLFFF